MPANNEVRNINLFGNMLSLKQDIFDAVHPIGETYTQYPQQDPPATVYNKNGITSEWEPISYDGAFFRAEGTNANPFTEKGTALNVQGQTVQSHHHGMQHRHEFSHGHHMDHQHDLSNHTHDLSNHTHSINHGHSASGSYNVGASGAGSDMALSGTQYYKSVGVSVSVSGYSGSSGGPSNNTSGGPSNNSTGGGRVWTDLTCYHTNDNWATWWGDNYTNIAQVWKDNAYINKDNTDDTGSTETRPKNLTIRVWRRKA